MSYPKVGQTGYSVTKLSTSDTYIIFLYQFILKQLFLLEAVQACVQLRLVKNGPDSPWGAERAAMCAVCFPDRQAALPLQSGAALVKLIS